MMMIFSDHDDKTSSWTNAVFLSQSALPEYGTSKRCAIIAGTTIVCLALAAILIGVYMFIDGEKAMIEVSIINTNIDIGTESLTAENDI